MSSVLTITEDIKTLAQLERHLGIRLSDEADFFQEWLGHKSRSKPSELRNGDEWKQHDFCQIGWSGVRRFGCVWNPIAGPDQPL